MKEQLIDFLKTSAASQKVVKHLKKGIEIAIQFEDQTYISYFQTDKFPTVVARAPQKHDVVFWINDEGLKFLVETLKDDVGHVGVEVLKQYFRANVRIRIVGSIFNLLRNGYLGIIKEGGPDFAKFLASKGVSNISKIPEIIKKMKNQQS